MNADILTGKKIMLSQIITAISKQTIDKNEVKLLMRSTAIIINNTINSIIKELKQLEIELNESK
jgi:hypothetical protein